MLTLIYLWFLCICTTQSQFKDHVDFQKITEINFRNEKYNVLKPTVHVVEDHFKAFIQKRHNNLQSERIFLDKNGFRHFWKGMEKPRPNSLRKTDLINIKDENKTANNITDNGVKKLDKPKRKKRKEEIYVPVKPSLRNPALAVRTTFYCPFFGVIRMTTDVDNNEELKDFM